MARRPPVRERHERRPAGGPRREARSRPRPGERPTPVRVTATRIVLLVALLGSVLYLAYAILVVRDTNAIPMLSSGAAILGVVFMGLALAGAKSTLDAGREGSGRAFLYAIGGGIAAIIGFGCFAGAVILALVVQPS